MWEKMYWDMEVFSDIQRSYPDEGQPLVYAALNACIAAWSLETWARNSFVSGYPQKEKQDRRKYFDRVLANMIPLQAMCSVVANTAKHGAHRDSGWDGGSLSLKWDDGDECGPAGFVLVTKGQTNAPSMLNSLFDLPRDWWDFLQKMELVEENLPTPNWLRRKLSRMFGGIPGVKSDFEV